MNSRFGWLDATSGCGPDARTAIPKLLRSLARQRVQSVSLPQPAMANSLSDSKLNQVLPRDVPYRRALIVANPIAGRGKAAHAADELAEGLRRYGTSVDVHLTRERGDGKNRVQNAAPDTDLVVAIGGDGTLGEVLSGLSNLETPVGVLPMGTSNVLGIDLRLPRDVDGLLEVLLARNTRKIDLATVNGEVSFLVSGIGIDGEIVRRLEELRRGPITKLSYIRPIVAAFLQFPAPRLSVELDGEKLEGDYGLVFASNIIHYAAYIRLSRERVMDDGELEIYLFKSGSRLSMLSYLVRGLFGWLPGGECEMRRAKRIKVEADRPIPYQVDGDFRGYSPVEIEVTDRQVQLLTPATSTL